MYSELCGHQQTTHRTLLSRMGMEPQSQLPNLPHQQPNRPRATSNLSPRRQTPYQDPLSELPLSRSQPSIRMYSSNATPSWKNTERGRCLSQPYTRRSEPSSPHPSRKTLRESMQRLVPSSQQSKAMIRRQQWQPDEGRELDRDEAPSLLSRMSQNLLQTKNLSPKNQKSTSQPLHGRSEEHTSELQ